MTRHRARLALLLTAAVLAAAASPAQARAHAEDEVLSSLEGHWSGSGMLMGRSAKFEMSWEWVLGGEFLRLTFRNALVTDAGEQTVLTSQAFYRRQEDGSLRGTWFDSRGMVLPLQSRIEDGALITQWGDGSTERGTTTYRPTPEGVEVVDMVHTDGGEREFARASYTRKPQS